MEFKVGDKVRCITTERIDWEKSCEGYKTTLELNKIYTISSPYEHILYWTPAVRIEEDGQHYYHPDHFVPIPQPQLTDFHIAVDTALQGSDSWGFIKCDSVPDRRSVQEALMIPKKIRIIGSGIDRVRIIKDYGRGTAQSLVGKIGTVMGKSEDRYLIEFDTLIEEGHDGNTRGTGPCGMQGYCWYMSDDCFELIGEPLPYREFNSELERAVRDIKIERKVSEMRPSLLKRLIDADTRIIADEVMDNEGNLFLNDPRVQEALLATDGFRAKLVEILKADKAEREKKNKC